MWEKCIGGQGKHRMCHIMTRQCSIFIIYARMFPGWRTGRLGLYLLVLLYMLDMTRVERFGSSSCLLPDLGL